MSATYRASINTLDSLISLCDTYIRRPDDYKEKGTINHGYGRIYSIVDAIRCIDSHHIGTRRSIKDQKVYHNTKKFHSIVLKRDPQSKSMVIQTSSGFCFGLVILLVGICPGFCLISRTMATPLSNNGDYTFIKKFKKLMSTCIGIEKIWGWKRLYGMKGKTLPWLKDQIENRVSGKYWNVQYQSLNTRNGTNVRFRSRLCTKVQLTNIAC